MDFEELLLFHFTIPYKSTVDCGFIKWYKRQPKETEEVMAMELQTAYVTKAKALDALLLVGR